MEDFPGSRKCDDKHWAFLLPHEIDKTLSLVNHFPVFIWIHLQILFPNFQHVLEYCNDFTSTGTTKRLSMICCFSADLLHLQLLLLHFHYILFHNGFKSLLKVVVHSHSILSLFKGRIAHLPDKLNTYLQSSPGY